MGGTAGVGAPAPLLGGGPDAAAEMLAKISMLVAKVKELDAQLGNVMVFLGGADLFFHQRLQGFRDLTHPWEHLHLFL
jgi:hypothetical protein